MRATWTWRYLSSVDRRVRASWTGPASPGVRALGRPAGLVSGFRRVRDGTLGHNHPNTYAAEALLQNRDRAEIGRHIPWSADASRAGARARGAGRSRHADLR